MTSTALAAVRTEGGLLPGHLLTALVTDPQTVSGTRAEDYHLTPGKKLREVINRSWNDLNGAWQAYQAALARPREGDPYDTTVTRDKWLLPLLQELGFGRVQRAQAVEIDGKTYPVSHRWEHVPIHLLGAGIPLDRRTPGVAGAATGSPHSIVQELLNRTDESLWAIVSNGQQFRLVRDNTSLTRVAYVEFDLEAMFGEQSFSDFVALWMTCHQSRFEGDPPAACRLETWVNEARQQGVRALEHLRDGVEASIVALGTGFLAHPGNRALRDALREGQLSKQDYYRQVLRLVYRMLFLLVAEDRNLLHAPSTSDTARDTYAHYYSLSRIRELARRRRGTKHADLWHSLRITFNALRRPEGEPALGLSPLGGLLWSDKACADIEPADIANTHLLEAVRALAYTVQDRTFHKVDYVRLGSDELGSVYESLLELVPELNLDAGRFTLRTASGNERKTTGSYYTPTSLINALLDRSLDPLLDEAASKPDAEQAILDLKVVDPACGSGHFLIAAAKRIADRLASVRTGEDSPTPEAVQHALRDVVGRCLYGIDINPMAVELCKVNLWLEAVDPGRPLSFLDQRIIHGNGLIGATPALLEAGVPDEAFKPIEGDNKPTATRLKKTNKAEREERNQALLSLDWNVRGLSSQIADQVRAIAAVDDSTIEGAAEKDRRWAEVQDVWEADRAVLAAHAFCAAFFVEKQPNRPPITFGDVRLLGSTPRLAPPALVDEVLALAHRYNFFHPHLVWPEVFSVPEGAPDNPVTGWSGGFDLVLGNPPWDTLSPDAKEFFAAYDSEVRFLKKSQQKKLIDELLEYEHVADAWTEHRRDLFATVHFLKNSGRYRMFAPGNLGKGDFNVYRMFVETALDFTKPDGWAAQITPSGIYNGANASGIRAALFDRFSLRHVLGFINTGKKWFPGIHAETRFALYAAQKAGSTESFTAAFGLEGPTVTLTDDDVVEMKAQFVRDQAPDSLAIPETTGGLDVDVTTRLYVTWPAFGLAEEGFPHRQYQREIDMGNDRDLFNDSEPGLPLYEGRMIDQFDHRAKAYRSGRGRAAVWEELPFGSAEKDIVPQWRVPPRNVPDKVGDRVNRFRIAFSDVTSPQAPRSLVAALIPPGTICGHSAPTFTYPSQHEWAYIPWLATANSVVVDFLIRKRVALHVSLSILDGMPIARLPLGDSRLDRLAPLVLALTCTSDDMVEFWNAMAQYGWVSPSDGVPAEALVKPDERAAAKAQIEAAVARDVYRLQRKELEFILGQFPALRRGEEKQYGEYRTERLVMEAYDGA